MIHPNELRTGNILQYWIGEDGIEWELTKVDWQDIKWCAEKNENFNKVHKAITLTEEWLTKFGFKKEKYLHQCYSIDQFYLSKNLTSVFWYSVLSYNSRSLQWDKLLEIADLQYIHQLQNLYLALTGTELLEHDSLFP